jgi:hypothetical protein
MMEGSRMYGSASEDNTVGEADPFHLNYRGRMLSRELPTSYVRMIRVSLRLSTH